MRKGSDLMELDFLMAAVAEIGLKRDGKQSAPAKPQVFCGPVCLIYCPFGNVLDSQGCPTCACNKPTRASVRHAKRTL